MGEGIYAGISKGPVHQRVDELVNHRDASGRYDKRAAFLAALEDDAQDYVDILQEHAGVTAAEATYLRATWYNPGQDGWWHTLQPILPIVREGLVKAVREAITHELPLDSYWLVGGKQVDVTVAVSAHQVTRIIQTPPTVAPVRNRTRKAPMWRVTHARGESVGQETYDELVEKVSGDVATVRRKEFA